MGRQALERAQSESLHPRYQLSGLLAQVPRVQAGFGSCWDLSQTRALPKPPMEHHGASQTGRPTPAPGASQTRALTPSRTLGTTRRIPRTNIAAGKLYFGSSLCYSCSPCQASTIREVMRTDSYELARRSRSFGAVYRVLPRRSGSSEGTLRASRRFLLHRSARRFGAKGKERPLGGTTCASLPMPRCCCWVRAHLSLAPRGLTAARWSERDSFHLSQDAILATRRNRTPFRATQNLHGAAEASTLNPVATLRMGG